ncbi:hypothetical protein HHL01_06575 [Pseudoalteromonas arctica]|uniref:Large protein n=1 Tax=Pseudoalteromonas arctica TaxID=394751 RepID=A0A7X9U562_9GAMM|nr:AHH domain-containing protein [Pseudoalteromonas arctica]NMF47842.1 hypothetical protein [Pseudoalteromonas arctica]
MIQLQRYPMPDRPSNPSPLEMAIYNYELLAKKHYDDKRRKSAASKEKLQRDYDHLQKERKRLEHLLIAQQSLESYRAESGGSSVKELAEEEHHPTEKLAKFLRAAGEPKPTSYHEAHHIVCGKGRYRQRLTYAARLRMHSFGIGINDPTNGVWLRNFEKNKSDDWATPDTVSHRRLHRHNYEVWVSTSLRTKVNKLDFINALRGVKIKIKNHMMPASVMMRKNANWDGKS